MINKSGKKGKRGCFQNVFCEKEKGKKEKKTPHFLKTYIKKKRPLI